MKRRNFLQNMTLASAAIAGTSYADVANVLALSTSNENKLTPPKTGKIPVAFLISRGVTMIDYAGPWEVFQDVHVPSRGSDHSDQMPFDLFTVSDTTGVVVGSAGFEDRTQLHLRECSITKSRGDPGAGRTKRVDVRVAC